MRCGFATLDLRIVLMRMTGAEGENRTRTSEETGF